jgi:hypothetical protein
MVQSSESGSEQWLEASAQLAAGEIRRGNFEQARRIIGLVEILVPDWGNKGRMEEMTRLKRLMEEGDR